jgi:large subunit ribosomal protein L29
MKAKDLRERSVEELRELEKSLARDSFTHRFKNFTNRLDDTSVIGKSRRDLARVKTILQQMEAKAAAPAAAAAAPKEAAPKEAAPKKPAAKKKTAAKKSEAK